MASQVTAGRFVGRTQQLARLRELLTRAADSQPLVALLGGEAGVGKTRLVEQLAATARERGVRVLGGGCVPLGEEGLPFAPVIQALRGLADDLDADELQAVAGPARQELARLLPHLPWGGEAAAGSAVASRAGQGWLFELLLGVVQRLAATAPLLWIVEDLHWADRSTRDLLAYLATYLRAHPVLLVVTFRSDELHRRHPLRRLLSELARNRRVQRLELPRFTRAELTQQLTGLLGTDPPARLVEDVYARSEGNPFFAEELVLAGNGGGPRALPPSLQEVLLTRVVRLGHHTQQLLGVAAAAGPGATQPLLAAVADMDDQQLLDGLREAVDQQLLVPEPGGGDGYVFRHALLAEAVYAELLPGERVGLHSALAAAVEAGLEAGDTRATRAARIAYHWSAAGDQPRALTASVSAAAAAEQAYAFAEAQLQLERALGLWDQVPDAEERVGMDWVGLLARCAETAYWAGDIGRAAELVRQALGLVDAARQPRRAGLLHEQLARCLGRLGDPWAGALAEQQQAVRLVPPEPSAERARVLGSLALYLERADRFAEARELAEEAVAIAEQVGAHAEEANARTALGAALGYLGEPDAGLAELAAARRLATQAGDAILALRTIVYHSDVLLAAGHLDQAATVALDGIQQARRLGLARSYGPVLAANATEALVALGRWEQAEQLSRQALETAPSDAVSVHLPLARAALELGLGDLDAAQARLQAVRRLLPAPIPVAERAGLLFAGLAELALWRRDLDQAKQLMAQAVPQVEANPRYAASIYALGLRVEADLAELARARHPGQPAHDDATATTLLQRLDQAAAGQAAAGLPELAAWHVLGLAERTRQDRPSDPAAWAAAAAAWERLGQPYRTAYAWFRQAEALLATGDRDTAAVVLDRAAEVTGRLGARHLDTEVKALARRARLHLGAPAEAPAAAAGPPTPAQQLGLTPREVEVLALVAAGRSNRQIAQALFISPKTVGVHVSNLLAKLGVAGRVEAATIAHRLGLD
jgi:DNA-binding CsgD family transcriptional regulator/tetratricopeptide (TPR) repeat protein